MPQVDIRDKKELGIGENRPSYMGKVLLESSSCMGGMVSAQALRNRKNQDGEACSDDHRFYDGVISFGFGARHQVLTHLLPDNPHKFFSFHHGKGVKILVHHQKQLCPRYWFAGER